MKVNNMIRQGNWLILVLDNPRDMDHVLDGFLAGEYELTRKKQKRSLDANAYCWVLITKIAARIHDIPVDVYRRYVRDVGQKTVITCVMETDVETEAKAFLEHHIGRSIEVGDSRLQGCVTLHKHYGSSDYDTAQMARFLDLIIQDCRELGIETRPEEEVQSLLRQWGKKHG